MTVVSVLLCSFGELCVVAADLWLLWILVQRATSLQQVPKAEQALLSPAEVYRLNKTLWSTPAQHQAEQFAQRQHISV